MSEWNHLANLHGTAFKVALEPSASVNAAHRDVAMRVHQLALEKMEEGLKSGPNPMSVLPYAQIAQSTGVQFHMMA